jgi:hypothetical protein
VSVITVLGDMGSPDWQALYLSLAAHRAGIKSKLSLRLFLARSLTCALLQS